MKTRIAMKTLLAILYLCIALTGCTSNEKKNHTTSIHQEESTTEIQEKEFPKAACILWIDKNKEKTLKGKLIRNVKARVHIGELGKITILEYEKKTHFIFENKINHCLKTYRVTPEQMEKGNLKEGENIVFLRFIERELNPDEIL
jgi:ABC-type uncharacterized transport system auxiliary subunit